MTPSSSRSGSSALAGAVLFALGVAVALADYRESFQRGIKAIDNKDWVGAITAFRESIAEKPAEGERVLIYGMRFKPYLPHYYLGIAHFNTGNCDAAMKAWAESERQGAVKETVEYRTLQSLRAQCRGQGAREAEAPPPTRPVPAQAPTAGPDLRQAIAEAEAEIKRGENAATAVARLRAEPDNARLWQAEPSLREGENKANRDLASARTSLAEARAAGDPARISQAREAAGRARQEFESLQKLAADRRDRFEREARDRQAKEAEKARQAAIEKQAREKEARDRQAALDLQAKEKLAKQKTAEKPVLPTAVPKAASKQAPPVPSPVPERKPPAALLQAAAAYFEGDYGRAAETLRDADFQDSRAAAQASLIRGAARFGIYVTGGEKDESLKNQAVEDIRESLRLDPKIAVTTRAFSPRFVEFFKRNGSPGRG